LKHSQLVAVSLLQIVFGEAGAKLFEIMLIVYALGVINGLLLTGSFLARAMSEDNPIFGFLQKTDRRTATPLRALVFNGFWACVLVIVTGSFEALLYITGLWVWIFFAMVSIAIIVFRVRKINSPNRFNMPGYPVIPVVVAIISLALAWSTVSYMPRESLWGTFLMLGGLPFFFFQKKPRQHQ
jgi:APA family basic amino acid/polyamine antiporter